MHEFFAKTSYDKILAKKDAFFLHSRSKKIRSVDMNQS